MPPPMTPPDVMGIIALLTGCVVAMWALPGCGHPGCLEAHKAAKAKDHADFLRRLHETHDAKYPTPTCPHCDQRP